MFAVLDYKVHIGPVSPREQIVLGQHELNSSTVLCFEVFSTIQYKCRPTDVKIPNMYFLFLIVVQSSCSKGPHRAPSPEDDALDSTDRIKKCLLSHVLTWQMMKLKMRLKTCSLKRAICV